MRASYFSRRFDFGFEARTSRGRMEDKISWFICLSNDDPSVVGIGECGPLPGLSIDAVPEFEKVLEEVLERFNGSIVSKDDLTRLVPPGFPSILFGLETALLDLHNGGRRLLYKNDFMLGRRLPINGLIWMGDIDFMTRQVDEKIEQGFRCIKLKVGGLDFETECAILHNIRRRYKSHELIVRLDANGAFSPADALRKLTELARFEIQSIEQPIMAGLPEMEMLCRNSPVPIALDEELIGLTNAAEKVALIERLKPTFIILKPTLHGGLSGTEEWIALAEAHGVGWWITSALESSIGLNAICQLTANYPVTLHQGLGTGKIYTNNFVSPLQVQGGAIYYDHDIRWDDGLPNQVG